jgi:hypothetical protein
VRRRFAGSGWKVSKRLQLRNNVSSHPSNHRRICRDLENDDMLPLESFQQPGENARGSSCVPRAYLLFAVQHFRNSSSYQHINLNKGAFCSRDPLQPENS